MENTAAAKQAAAARGLSLSAFVRMLIARESRR